MDTLKTAVVVVLLLAVLYGVYVVLNKPEQYQQDLAWQTGAADPALDIELGIPETDGAMTAASAQGTSWGSAPQAQSQGSDTHSDHLHEVSSSIEQDLPTLNELSAQPELSDQHSLPIPEPTTPAPPDLLGDTDSSATDADELTATDASFVPESTSDTVESPSVPEVANALRQQPNEAEPAMDRFGDANRYSRYETPAGQPVSDVATPEIAQPTEGSTQANVNDVAENSSVGSSMSTFQSVMQSVHTKLEAEAWKDALYKLSLYYNDPSLSDTEFSQLVDLLDPLAGKVIYSTEHLIEPAYQSQPGDTLKNIADRYQVPWQLLANINGIENPETLLAGRELKVVRGPFRAEVSLTKNELTVFADKLYAGRFPITVGNNPAPPPGKYQVNDKQPGRTYYVAGSGQTIPIDDPSNPYGRVWIDLGSDISIHGSSPNYTSPEQSCIALTARDAGDVFGILSKGSSVVIVR